MGIKVKWNLTLTLTLIPWELKSDANEVGWDEYIKIILFQYCQYFKLEQIILQTFLCSSFTAFFSFSFFFFFLAALLCHSWSSGAISPRGPTPVKGGCSFCVERTRYPLVLPRSGGFRSGDRWPSRKFCPRKNATPQSGCKKPRKGRAGSSLSGWPQAPSGVPAVLFPFSREDVHRFPLRVQAVSP